MPTVIKRFIFLLLLLFFTGQTQGWGQCGSINFSADVLKGCSLLPVKFIATGAPAGSTFTWDFGSGTVAGTDTIYKAFADPGKFTVVLKVKLPNGSICTISKADYINVLATPNPKIAVEPGRLICNGPQEVKFTDNTPNITEREWIIDGVSYKDKASITHIFTSTGYKSVTLKVKNSLGCTGLLSQNKFVQILDSLPVDFCSNIVIASTGITANFTPNIGTTTRTITNYEWSFPDGTPSSYNGKTPPTVKYKNDGNKHDVKLVLTTAEGCKYTVLRKNLIQPYISVSEDSLCMGKPATISNLAKNSGRGFFEWNTLDANLVGPPGDDGLVVMYSKAGQFDLKMKFKYSQFGCLNEVYYPKYITSLGPQIGFYSPQKTSCDPNAKIELINNTNLAGATDVYYTWRIYDSLGKPIKNLVFGPTKTKNASFYIKQYGKFGVSLSAKSSSTCSDSVFIPKYFVIDNPTATITVDTPEICLGQVITFRSSPSPADDKGDIYKYIWNFQHTTISSAFYTSLGQITTFEPLLPGKYNVTHIIQNGDNCGDTVVKNNFFTVYGASASISLDETTGCAGMGTRAVGKVTDKYPNTPGNNLKYLWQVIPSEGVNIINKESQIAYIQFWENGSYDIILNIIDQKKCTTQVIEEGLVNLGVTSGFDIPQNRCLGDSLPVFVYASDDAETYKWTLTPAGAGVIYPSDTVRNIKVIYNKDTCYQLKLVTTKLVNGGVCSDSTIDSTCMKLPTAAFESHDSVLYCSPAIANFQNNSLNGKSFLWEFGDGTSVLNNSKSAIAHVYLRNNLSGFNVKLTAFDTFGCSSIIEQKNLVKIIGPVPKFTIDKKSGCDNALIKFTNQSANIKNFVLIYDDGTILDSNKIEDHIYTLENKNSDSMVFYPVLLATDNTNCQAFYRDTVTIYQSPKAEFYSDTLNACVPYKASFKNTSLRAKAWWWDFNNDGIIDDTVQNPQFTFSTPGRYTVKLLVKNNGGCYDSIIKENYINVEPIPEAKFEADKHAFCDKAEVKFTDSSRNYTYFIFDYGDSSALETSVIPTHLYAYYEGRDTADSVVYFPQLIAYNTAGCADTFRDTIVVFANPVPGFSEDTLSGCAPLTITFTDTSHHSFITEWDFENDGKTDTTGPLVTHTFGPGTYTVKQKNTSGFGCTDSIIKVNHIYVNEPPVAAFAVSDSIVCIGEKIQFTDLSTPKANLRSWQWHFSEPGLPTDSSKAQNPEVQLYTPGYHIITLRVTDNNGCENTIAKKAVYVEDSLPPQNSEILYVTVNKDGNTEIAWRKNSVYDFEGYHLQRADTVAEIFSSNHFSDTLYMDTAVSVSTKSYCYAISTTDQCGNISLQSSNHCTILLQAVSTGSGKVRLMWNSYKGWQQVREYRIYRSGSGSNFAQIASVAGTVLLYNDSNLCDENYCYYVEAVHTNNNYFSRSNISCLTPIYIYQTAPLQLQYATVQNDKNIKLKWNSGIQENLSHYIIDKYTNGNGWLNNYATGKDTFFTDAEVNVFAKSYAYRVRTQDVCGYYSPNSNSASSIFLRASVDKDKVLLKWNKYFTWSQDVKEYELQIRRRDGKFVTVTKLSATDSIYIDDSVYTEIDTAYCYRIVAHENSLQPFTSVSNTSCAVLAPRMYAPNAFSPNNDNLNDVWNVSAISIYNKVGSGLRNYNLRIYDRWGSLVFESNDLFQGWNGTRNGVLSPIGVYVYIIQAEGLNGNYINLKGNITLIR